MNYLSVCSGIEAATVAWHHLGWDPVGFSEIEPFPSAVLNYHYPNVPNFGDMNKYETWRDATNLRKRENAHGRNNSFWRTNSPCPLHAVLEG